MGKAGPENAPESTAVEIASAEDATGEASSLMPSSAFELDSVTVCGLELRMLRRRHDFFAACAGDLPVRATGTVLWECGVLLADYLGYARWLAAQAGGAEPGSGAPWWMLHPPAPVVPTRFWSAPERGLVLELGGGCGLVAAVLSSLGARVLCTDGDPNALRTARQNCADARRRHDGARGDWGDVSFRELKWGDAEAARSMSRDCGPFGLIVGSDLLYGEEAKPAPLVETLAELCVQTPEGVSAAEVIIAIKNRCRNEVRDFCRLASERDIWHVRLADVDDFPEGFDGRYQDDRDEDCAAYAIIHLVPKPRGVVAERPPDAAEAARAQEGASAEAAASAAAAREQEGASAEAAAVAPPPAAKRPRVCAVGDASAVAAA